MDNQLRQHSLGPSATDNWGFQWTGVQGVGILRLDTRLLRGTMWELGVFGSDVRDLARGEGWVVLAGHNRNQGITFWKGRENLWDHLEPRYTAGLESSWINDLAVTGRWLLAATDAGLAQIDMKNGSSRMWTLFHGLWSNRATSVTADRDTVWIGTENGVSVLNIAKKEVKRLTVPELANQPIYRLAVDAEALWAGGEGGLFRLDRAPGAGGWLELEGGVGGAVYALQVTPREIIAGRFGGVEIIDKATLAQTGYPAEAFVAGSAVNAVLAMDSLVWVGTDQGLWKLDRSRNRWHRYTDTDGLLSLQVTALQPDGDHLLIGTPEGVTRFRWNDPSRGD
jgi:ligand-binding sensor domain-containing protein